MKKGRIYIADGNSCAQQFDRFADARKAALSAPWADGTVYRHNAEDVGEFMPMPTSGKLVFTAPGGPFYFPERGGLFPEWEQ